MARENLKKIDIDKHEQQGKLDTCLEIRHYLEDNGITQSFLNKKTKIGAAKISLTLQGKRRLTLEEYSYICWALGVNTDKFLQPKSPDDRKRGIKNDRHKKNYERTYRNKKFASGN